MNSSQQAKMYVSGFVSSAVLTAVAFSLVKFQQSNPGVISQQLVVIGLVILAILQLIAQLYFFFHLGQEKKPKLNTISFLFMTMVICIIGFGSLWIMYNLDYNMHGKEAELYLQKDENITPSSDHQH
jgi:cytochrome o ubiquinol oxidase operon protein cyoD